MPQQHVSAQALNKVTELEIKMLEGLRTALRKAEGAVSRRLSKRHEAASTQQTTASGEHAMPVAGTGDRPGMEMPLDPVQEASEDSFPASDPPSFTGSWSG